MKSECKNLRGSEASELFVWPVYGLYSDYKDVGLRYSGIQLLIIDD